MASERNRWRFRMIAPSYPAFNIYSRVARRTTALGPLSVATVISLLDGWEAEVIDENNYRMPGPRDRTGRCDHRVLQSIRRADVVGLYGGLSSTIPRLYEIARFYRQQGVTTIAGGQHFLGENIREALDNGVDYVVVGEGEDTIGELLGALREGRDPAAVPGLAFLRDGQMVRTADRPPIEDFDRLPLPDFSLLRYARIRIYPINWVRGCGMECEFCTVKGRPRPSSVARVMEQIATLVETQGARHFFIVDDLFGSRRKEALELCRRLADYQASIATGLDITVQIRLDRAKDAELLQAMRSARINTVCIGFESPIPEELEAMNKKGRPEEMLDLTRIYHKAGFLVHGMFIFGYPLPEGARLSLSAAERARHFRSFVRKARLDTIQVLLPVPLPGTEMTERLTAQHRVFPRDCIGWEYYDGNFPLFEPDPPLTAESMHDAVRKIMGRFYRFRHAFGIALNVILFPAMIFSVFNFRLGWRKWYRAWRNDLTRLGGWVIVKRWTSAFKRGDYAQRLARAHEELRGLSAAPPDGPSDDSAKQTAEAGARPPGTP